MAVSSLRDVVKAQGDAIENLNKLIAAKLDKSDLASALQDKVNVGELTSAIDGLASEMDNKADARDTSAVLQQMSSRTDISAALASKASISEVQECLDKKADTSDTQRVLAQLEKRVNALDARIAEALAQRPPPTPSEERRTEIKALVAEQVEGLRQSMRRDVIAESSRTRQALQASVSELDRAARLDDVESLVAEAVAGMREELRRDVEREFDVYVRCYLPEYLEAWGGGGGARVVPLLPRRPWRP